IRALEHVAIDESARTEERSHARGYALRQSRVANALEDHLSREVGIDAFLKRQNDVREPIQGNRPHHLQVRRPVHGQLERQRRQPLDLFRRMPWPLVDRPDHRRRKSGESFPGLSWERNGPNTTLSTVIIRMTK